MKHDETIEREAEAYASQYCEGLGYVDWHSLMPRYIEAFLAGAQAERKRAENLVRTLRFIGRQSEHWAKVAQGQHLVDLQAFEMIARQTLAEWEGAK
jgi:hypothetical protein